jgi:hypothetical protein
MQKLALQEKEIHGIDSFEDLLVSIN